jgi:hypothetical protein
MRGDSTCELTVAHMGLLDEFLGFAQVFDGSDAALARSKIVSMLEQLEGTDTVTFFKEWEGLKAFAWNTRFPGRVPIFVVLLLRTREVLKWRKDVFSLRRALLEVRKLSHTGDLTQPRIKKMKDALNAVEVVAIETLNEAEAVPVLPEISSTIDVGTDPESQSHEVLTGTTESPEMEVMPPHPIHFVQADDQDADSEMSSH